MDEKKLIIIGVIIVILAVVVGFMLTSSNDSQNSKIDIISGSEITENGTIDVKLTNTDGIALKDKTVHVTVSDDKGNVVFSKDSATYANGVANVRIDGVKAGTYNVNVTFDGDANFTSSSVSQELKINAAEVEDNSTEEDSDVVDDTSSDDTQTYDTPSSSYSYSSSSQSSSYSSSSSSSSQASSDDSGSGGVIDENGNSVNSYIDENGNEVIE